MTKIIDDFIEKEYKFVQKYWTNNTEAGADTNSSDRAIKEIYNNVHKAMICSLIAHYMSNKCDGFHPDCYCKFFVGDYEALDFIPDDLSFDDIPSICEDLHINYLNTSYTISNNKLHRKKSKDNLIEHGAVYTQNNIVYEIITRTLSDTYAPVPEKIKILDFAAGTGRFYTQLVKYLKEKWYIDPEISVTECIYAIDIDPIAVNICRLKALSILDNVSVNALETVAKHIICKNGLIKGDLFDESAIKESDCDGLFDKGFDAIVSNPPYLVLKPNKNKMDEATIASINNQAKFFRTSSYYQYSIEGMLNLYQISLEAMLSMLKPQGNMGIICPSTLFADISASKLRKYLLSKHNITYIKFISENDPIFDNVTQATCIFHLSKNIPTITTTIVRDNKQYTISIDDVKELFSTNWEIPSIEEIEWSILKKLKKFKKLKEWSYIRNKRGELDLSLYKKYITTTPTKYRLVRGNMISDDGIVDINHEYVDTDFIKEKSQDFINNDYGHRRLVCQQISNQTQKIRLHFVTCNENDILGNSCNYITVPEDDIDKIQTLLNSALLNWRFKTTSTNNHINNYEIDELPIIPIERIKQELFSMTSVEQDRAICKFYGLTNKETDFIISQHYEAI